MNEVASAHSYGLLNLCVCVCFPQVFLSFFFFFFFLCSVKFYWLFVWPFLPSPPFFARLSSFFAYPHNGTRAEASATNTVLISIKCADTLGPDHDNP